MLTERRNRSLSHCFLDFNFELLNFDTFVQRAFIVIADAVQFFGTRFGNYLDCNDLSSRLDVEWTWSLSSQIFFFSWRDNLRHHHNLHMKSRTWIPDGNKCNQFKCRKILQKFRFYRFCFRYKALFHTGWSVIVIRTFKYRFCIGVVKVRLYVHFILLMFMFWIKELHNVECSGSASIGYAILVTGDGHDGTSSRVGTSYVTVVEIDHFDAVGAASSDNGVFSFTVVLLRKNIILWEGSKTCASYYLLLKSNASLFLSQRPY